MLFTNKSAQSVHLLVVEANDRLRFESSSSPMALQYAFCSRSLDSLLAMLS